MSFLHRTLFQAHGIIHYLPGFIRTKSESIFSNDSNVFILRDRCSIEALPRHESVLQAENILGDDLIAADLFYENHSLSERDEFKNLNNLRWRSFKKQMSPPGLRP